VVLCCITGLPLLTALWVLVPRDDVYQQVLRAETTMTLTNKARHPKISWPDSVEANLIEFVDLRSADDVHPIRVAMVLQQTRHCSIVVKINTETE